MAALHARSDGNAQVIFDWIDRTPWVQNLAVDRSTWSNTSVCLTFCDPSILALDANAQAIFSQDVAQLLAKERVALDVSSYRGAPPGLRLWAGATVERQDLADVLPWIEWAFDDEKKRLLAQ